MSNKKPMHGEIGMQDTSPRLKTTRTSGLPVVSRFVTRASKEISKEGMFFLAAPRDTEDLLKNKEMVCGAQVIFISRGAALGVNRQC